MSDFNPSYTGGRDDILNLVPSNAAKILDIGCSTGTLGGQIKEQIRSAEVTGIELDKQMARVAESKLDRVIIGDINKFSFKDYFTPNYFDCIILADILEHLNDPWTLLAEVKKYLIFGGLIIASIPNVRHYSTIVSLLFKGYWPYRDRGIHDRTHLRFFTLKNIKEMFQREGLLIEKFERNYRLIEKPHKYNTLSRYFAFPLFRDFLTFQYIITARKERNN